MAHFLPDAELVQAGDRSTILMKPRRVGDHYRIKEDPVGLGLEIEWFGVLYQLNPGVPVPFTAAERRLIDTMAEVIDSRYPDALRHGLGAIRRKCCRMRSRI